MKTNKRLHQRLSKREQVSEFSRFLCMSRWGLYKVLKQEKRNLWGEYLRYVTTKEMYMLGQKVYYLNLSEDKGNVYEGVVRTETISNKGYRVYIIETEDGKVAKEKPYVFSDKEAAKAAFDAMMPVAKEMWSIQREANERCDALRLQLMGAPEFPDFIEEIKDEQNSK